MNKVIPMYIGHQGIGLPILLKRECLILTFLADNAALFPCSKLFAYPPIKKRTIPAKKCITNIVAIDKSSFKPKGDRLEPGKKISNIQLVIKYQTNKIETQVSSHL